MVVTGRDPHRLEPQIILVRPEPRHRIIRMLLADDRLSHGDGHVVRILDRFYPDDFVTREGVLVSGTIPDREDVREARPAIRIDNNSIVYNGAGIEQRLD